MPESGKFINVVEQLEPHTRVLQRTLGLLAATAAIAAASTAEATPIRPDKPGAAVIQSDLDGFIGPNVRLYNKPSGYHTSTGEKGDKFYVLQLSDNGDWAYGLLKRKDSWKPSSCGWTVSKVLTHTDISPEAQPCDKYLSVLKLRRNIGDIFNGYGRFDGKIVKLTDKCDNHFYQNKYTSDVGFNNVFGTPVKGDGFMDYVGDQFGKVRWRYTRQDKPAGMVEVGSDTYGWGMMEEDCVDPKDMVDPGGPKITNDTAAGPNPNANI